MNRVLNKVERGTCASCSRRLNAVCFSPEMILAHREKILKCMTSSRIQDSILYFNRNLVWWAHTKQKKDPTSHTGTTSGHESKWSNNTTPCHHRTAPSWFTVAPVSPLYLHIQSSTWTTAPRGTKRHQEGLTKYFHFLVSGSRHYRISLHIVLCDCECDK